MNCDVCERLLAEGVEGGQVREHVEGCERCGGFARGLAVDGEMLRAMGQPADDALALVRARVMDGIRWRAERRRWAVAAVGVAAALALLVRLTLGLALPGDVGPPQGVLFAARPPELPPAPVRRQLVRAKREAPRQPLRIEIATSDPDIKVIWFVDGTGGSL